MKCRSRSLAIYNNEFLLDSACVGSEMINWIAINAIGNYCLSKSHTRYITSSLLQYVLKISSSMNASGGRWRQSPTARSVTSTLPRVAHLLLMHHFSSLMCGLKMNPTDVKQVTCFQWVCGLSVFLSWCMCYPVWIHCCKRSNYDFCISQGSVATVLRWGGPNYSHLCQVSSWCCMPKIIKIGQYLTELFKK